MRIAILVMLIGMLLFALFSTHKYGQGIEHAKRLARETNIPMHPHAYQEVMCLDDGEVRHFIIFMPLEVTSRGKAAMDRYAKGYCESVFGPQGLSI